ncbi:MAG: hypothetical protein ISS45_02540 [Candidatus Omnitrophica bacterium]|nr:hypothetical protein [Candidatus Omnitrophota bacterium]
MTGANLKEQIKNLVKLQELDSRIYRLNNEKESIPVEIKRMEEKFEAEKQSISLLEKERLELEKHRKEKELDLAVKEEGIKKAEGQLYLLKTNQEYAAKLNEIGGIKADIAVIEEAILGIFDEQDKLKKKLNETKAQFLQEETKLNKEKEKLNLRMKEIEQNLTQLYSQRSQVTPSVEKNILSQYEKVLQNRNYLAIVKVENNACQGCNMKTPPQVINLIKMYREFVICEVCQRILYIEDDL